MALVVLTIAGGLASSIFIPLTDFLVQRFGWRNALMVLAAILAIGTILPTRWFSADGRKTVGSIPTERSLLPR